MAKRELVVPGEGAKRRVRTDEATPGLARPGHSARALSQEKHRGADPDAPALRGARGDRKR